MIISHANQFIFFHNPKCAGTSFRDALKPYHDDQFTFWGVFYAPYFRNQIDHTHLRLWETYAQFPRIYSCTATYNSVIFARNPFDRFLSAVNKHIKKFQTQINLVEKTVPQRVAIVEEFIQKALNIARITTDWRFIHFSPQIWYLKIGDRKVPRHIIPMSKGNSFMSEACVALGLPQLEVPWHNPSPVDLTPALESPVVTKFIREFYAADLQFFRNESGLSELAKPPFA